MSTGQFTPRPVSPRRIPAGVEADIVRRYEAGESADRIAAGTGYGKSSVCRTLKRNGVATRDRSRAGTGVAGRVLALYAAGVRIAHIAERVGRDKSVVHDILRENNAPYRPGLSTRPRAWAPADDAELARLYAAGLTADQAAGRLHRSQIQTRNRLRAMGLLKAGGAQRVYRFDTGYFSAVDSEPKAYWLGFLAADGCVSRTVVRISLKSADRGHLEKFAAAVGYTGPITEQVADRPIMGRAVRPSAMASLTLCSRRMADDLTRLGVTPRKSLTYAPWDGPAALMPHFWRGLLDGDGHWGLTRRGHAVVGLTGSRPAVDGFLAFVGRHTGYTAVVRPKGRAFQTAVANCEVVQSLVRLLYAGATAWLDRKKAVADDILGRSWPARKRRRPAYTPGGDAG